MTDHLVATVLPPVRRMRHLQTPLSLLVGYNANTAGLVNSCLISQRMTSLDLGPKSRIDCFVAVFLQADLSQLFDRRISLAG